MNARTPPSSRKILLLWVALKLVLCLSVASRNDLWYDEFWTYDAARLPVAEMLSRTAEDVHPPLYYFCVRPFAWQTNGWLLRLPSALFAAGVVYFLGLAGLALLGRRGGLVTAALAAASPMLTRYGAEARQYALIALLWTVALWALARLSTPNDARASSNALGGSPGARLPQPSVRLWTVYGLAVALGLYTHNLFALFGAGLGLMALLVAGSAPSADRSRQLIRWGLVHALLLLAYLPWVYRVLHQVDARSVDLGWMPIPGLRALQDLFFVLPFRYYEKTFRFWEPDFNRTLIRAGTVGFLLAAYALRRLADPRRRLFFAGLALALLTPTVLGYAVSRLVVPVIMPERFVVLLLPGIVLIVAGAIVALPQRRLPRAAVWAFALLLGGTMLAFTARMLYLPYNLEHRLVWQAIASATPAGQRPPPVFGTFAAWTEASDFVRHGLSEAPGGSFRGMFRKKALPLPAPEKPIWVVVSESALRADAPDVRLLRAILEHSSSPGPILQSTTMQAALIDRIDWNGVFGDLEGDPLLTEGWDSPANL